MVEWFRGNLVKFGVRSSLSNKYANQQLFEDNCIRYKSYGWGNSLHNLDEESEYRLSTVSLPIMSMSWTIDHGHHAVNGNSWSHEYLCTWNHDYGKSLLICTKEYS